MQKSLGKMFIILLIFSFSLFATEYKSTTLKKMMNTSTLIITGQVTDVVSQWDDSHSRIYTYVTVKIDEKLKGQHDSEVVVIRQLGGTVGDRSLEVSGAPVFKQDEDVLLFLVYHKDNYVIHSLAMGKFDIIKENNLKYVINKKINSNLIKVDASEITSESQEFPKYQFKKVVRYVSKMMNDREK